LAGHGGQQSRSRVNLILVVQQQLDAPNAPSPAKDLVSRSTPLELIAGVDSKFPTETGKLHHRDHFDVLVRLRVFFHAATIFMILAASLCSYRNRKQAKQCRADQVSHRALSCARDRLIVDFGLVA
jgi:hypothetical protein